MKKALDNVMVWLGTRLAEYLNSPIRTYKPFATHAAPVLEKFLQPGDVLLVEGNSRISTAIKYLTQSTWSHSAIFVGDTGIRSDDGEPCTLIEAEVSKGVIAVPLSKYRDFNTRICRPVGLKRADRQAVVEEVKDQLGNAYDLKHIFDLARYLFPTPPVPVRFRRRMLALGSNDPSRAICSTVIAQAFQHVKYPVLPRITHAGMEGGLHYSEIEILHIRHHSLFAPRDFDLSPYFRIVKPTIERGFDYRKLKWAPGEPELDEPQPDQAAPAASNKNKETRKPEQQTEQ